MNQAGETPIVPGARRWDFLAGLMKEMKFTTFVEVGCKEGRTTGFILANVPDSTAIAIDPWSVQEKGEDPTRETYEDWNFEKIEKDFWKNVGEGKDRCEMWRTSSAAAAESLRREAKESQYDVVFIDALHDYDSVKEDIELWWPFVRTGGVLAGHDANHKWPGVERALADSFNLMDVGMGPDSVWFVIKQEGY